MKTFKGKNNEVLGTFLENTDVVVNPTLSGDEPEMTGIQIGGQKYKAPQGGGGSGIVNEALYNSIVVPPSKLARSVDGSRLNVERLLDSLQKRASTDYHSTLYIAPYFNSSNKGSVFIHLTEYGSGRYRLVIFEQEVVVGKDSNYESIRNFLTSNKEEIENVTIHVNFDDENMVEYCRPDTVCLSTYYSEQNVTADVLVFSFGEVMGWFN